MKGELKVRDIDISRLKDRNHRIEFNDSIMTDKRQSYPSIDDTPNARTAKSLGKKPGRLYDVSVDHNPITYDSNRD